MPESIMKATVYISQSLVRFNEQQLIEMTELFAKNNAAKGITGYLFYHQDKFFQYIEGEEQQISDLMSSIKADKRHEVLNCYEDSELQERKFKNWGMQYIEQGLYSRVGLEQVIKSYFDYIDLNIGFETRWVERIWIATAKLADIQHRLIGR